MATEDAFLIQSNKRHEAQSKHVHPKLNSPLEDKVENQNTCSRQTVTCNLNISIHRGGVLLNNRTMPSKKNEFRFELKSSSGELVVHTEPDTCFADGPSKNLRPKPELNPIQPKKPNTAIVKWSKPITTLINNSWRKCKSDHMHSNCKISVNDVVMAKLSGFSAWPGFVLNFVNKNRAYVEFFGAERHEKYGSVDIKEMTLFKNSADVIVNLLKRDTRNFRKAVREAEHVCNIPETNSLCNIA